MSWNYPKKTERNADRAQQQGGIYAIRTDDAAKSDTLIRGKCEIGGKALTTLYDTGAFHSFLGFNKAADLGLTVSALSFDLHLHTSTSKIVVTKIGCQEVPFRVKNREFVHDFICLLITELDLILGLDWLSMNLVLLDSFERSIWFMSEESEGPVVARSYYLNVVKVNCSGTECQGFILFAANCLGDEQDLDRIPTVREFSKVFPRRYTRVFTSERD
ncbi:uncharacterized protein LOC107627108 [Arachis ipaensis]|uniref:uncharacterized protein LOC107627108 n=1 Tax=Arachis ipaensis TaxID=130454 RepID=UPI0007AFB517|nr:uncharacterized protein LOC107627108 [Arachis ipaensis]XP_025635843.1 uncharacterized protein LOC112729925 [Arachis hypogaea]